MKYKGIYYASVLYFSLSLFSCQKNENKEKTKPRFQEVKSETSGITFSNDLTENDSINYFTYPYLYMGGGVAIGDINNDGLSDIFFTGNMVENKLYLNKGDFEFEDITTQALQGDNKKWYAGVSLIDINSDGLLDIYLCVSGVAGDKSNELHINNGDLTFTEQASEFGLADAGNSVQATFLDYDHDGFLDVYVANYPITSFTTTNITYRFNMQNVTDEKSDHLYRNLGNGKFENVTKQSGLLSFGLSLSATVADFNQDGWEDIYVSNDFSTPDYFYINNGDGTFTDHLKKITRQTSFYGMGADAADINNDGLVDLFQVDMSAPDNRRTKANMASMNPSLFWSTVNSGFHYQYMYNSLQVNQGIKDGLPVMSNTAWMAGVASTDWSWAPLLADFDNDGWKDLFVANGTRKEVNNRDYFKDIEDELKSASGAELKKISDKIPSEPISNFIFKNSNGKKFENMTADWGLTYEGFSNGASYGDLDNDGDLDLVISNIDDRALVLKNNTSEADRVNYLKVKLEGQPVNTQGAGSEIRVYTEGQMQINRLTLVRGFQSSVEPISHFGLGEVSSIDSVVVAWPDGKKQVLNNIISNQLLIVNYSEADTESAGVKTTDVQPVFSEYLQGDTALYSHYENIFNDFYHQVLLPHRMSNFGPALAVGDVNGDGLDDMYVGAAVGSLGRLLIQNVDGSFIPADFQTEAELVYEDLDAVFEDFDKDGDLDLYVVSGGNEYDKESSNYQDRLYLNDSGIFSLTENVLPRVITSGSCVRPYDYDKDGDLDLFIGGRLDPRNYPYPGKSIVMENQLDSGELSFVDVTLETALELANIGMVTDALWADLDGDGTTELFVVGEWMPLTVFELRDGQFVNQSEKYFSGNTTGWWFSIEVADFDKDGDEDFMVGNLGLNYKYQAAEEETFNVYTDDFDSNGKSDIVLSYHNFGEEYPVRGRQCSSEQIPALKSAYKDYNTFSTAKITDIFGSQKLENSLSYKVANFSSIYIENKGAGKMTIESLPIDAQISPINDFIVDDYNKDGFLDVVLAGNLYSSEVETPRADAGIGLLLVGDGKGNFASQRMTSSGIYMPHDTKKLARLNMSEDVKAFAASNNDGPLQIFVQND